MSNKALRVIALAAIASGAGWALAAGPASAAETLKLDLRDVRNEASVKKLPNVPSTVQSQALAAGTGYVITVSGTGSIWPGTSWGGTSCGAAEEHPIEPSPGAITTLAGWDAATLFAAPFGVKLGPIGAACSGLQLPLGAGTNVYAGFEFATGDAYGRPSPYGGFRSIPRSDHTYSWQVAGEGKPARFRFVDSPAKDNSGILTIVVRTAAECTASNCLAKAGPEFDQSATPLVAAAAASVKVSGKRTCSSKQVLSVRVVPPTGVRIKKAVYYLSGKKTRIVGKKIKNSKPGRRLPLETFKTGFPKKKFTLKIDATTGAGQRLLVKRTVKKCTSKKAVVF